MLRKKFKIIYIFLTLIFVVVFSLGVFAQESKQELVAAFGTDISTFDLHNYRGIQDVIAGSLIYETLVALDKDGNIVPKLATSWEQIDSLTWKFYLRKGVKFHDGTPFTAKAAKFSIERCSAGGGGSFTGFIKEVEVVDDYTIVLHLKYEFGIVPLQLMFNVVSMMEPKFVEEKGEDIVRYTNGTGPFKLKEYIPATKAVFVKNEDYWGKPVKLDQIEFKTIREESTRIMALQSGEVDLIENPPPHEKLNIEKNKELYFYVSPKWRTLFLSFNLLDKNVGGEKNKPLREAISYAIDPQTIVDLLLEGLALSANGFIPESISKGLNDPSLVRKRDVEKARQILKEAGIEPGRTVEFWITKGRYLMDSAIGEVIQAQLSEVGINVDILTVEYATFISRASKHEQQMWQLAWSWSGEPFRTLNELFNSSSKWNLAAFNNEEFDKLITEAPKDSDFNKRMEIYNKAMKLLYDEVAVIPILNYNNVYAANKKVKGFAVAPNEIPYFDEIYIEE